MSETSKDKKKKSKKTKDDKSIKTQTIEKEDFTEINSNVVIDLNIQQCPTTAVTIFSDRAEVTRNIKGRVEQIGIHEVHINGLNNAIQLDTYRISGGIGID